MRQPNQFQVGMRLEVVDVYDKSLIRPATIVERADYHIKLHFDGWPEEEYDFWMDDDSFDLHPVGYCEETGHELTRSIPEGISFVR